MHHTPAPYITVEGLKELFFLDVPHQMASTKTFTSVAECLGSKCVHELLRPISDLRAECGGGGGPRHSLEV